MPVPESEEIFTTWTSDLDDRDISLVFLWKLDVVGAGIPGRYAKRDRTRQHTVMDVHPRLR